MGLLGLFGRYSEQKRVCPGQWRQWDPRWTSSSTLRRRRRTTPSRSQKMLGDHVVAWLSATEGQNVARLLSLITITIVWTTMHLSMLGLSVAAVWMEDSDKVLQTVEVIKGFADPVNTAFILILAFYFSARAAEKIADRLLGQTCRQEENTNPQS